MDFFLILQFIFDAVLFFGLLFLFHFTVHQSQGTKDESELLKNAQAQEMKENLQELLVTLKQLGKEVSENIQEQVREAEEKTETLKKIVQKLQRDLGRVTALAEEVTGEKNHLEEKNKIIQISKQSRPKVLPPMESIGFPRMAAMEDKENESQAPPSQKRPPKPVRKAMGVSSEAVKEVYRLADQSLGLNEIVQSTKLSRAEVQLILNLRGNRFSTPN